MKPLLPLLLFLAAIFPPELLPAGVECVETEDFILVRVHGKPVLRYCKAVQEPPEDIAPLFRRSGYIHPVRTPGGRVVTGDFAPDHPHQHAIFFAWRQTKFEGRKVDFWNQRSRTGTISHHRVLSVESGDDGGGFSVELNHTDLTAPNGPKPVMRETWTVRVHPHDDGFFRFDLEQEQRNISGSALVIEEYHYGGMALRGASAWHRPEFAKALKEWNQQRKADPDLPFPEISRGGRFLTSEGDDARTGNHTRPRWVDLTGPVEGQPAGISVLDHPDNFRFPQPVRLHPTKPYFCFAPMVLGSFTIEAGGTYQARYRYLVHDGPPDPGLIDREWNRYAGKSISKRSE